MARVVVALAVLSASVTAFAPSRSSGVRRAASGVHAASLEDTPVAPAAAAPADAAPGLAGVRPDLAAAFGRTPIGMLDEEAALARSAFPLPPETLIGLTKAWLASQVEDDGMDWCAHGGGGGRPLRLLHAPTRLPPRSHAPSRPSPDR